MAMATTTTASHNLPEKDPGICCFLLKYGKCEPPRPPCRFRHDVTKDDGVTPCCFGATCRFGHAKRALIVQDEEYWLNYKQYDAGASPAVRDATELQSQLEPWSTAVLRRRLAEESGADLRELDLLDRKTIMNRLLEHYDERGPRRIIQVEGKPVSSDLCAELLQALKDWRHRHGAVNTRPSIRAQSYMILRSPHEFDSQPNSHRLQVAAKKFQLHQDLWQLATRALREVDEDFCDNFSALAVTYGFSGSPHIDKQNTGPFYGLALGDFDGGGQLCVEVDALTVAHVCTKNRLGKVDGRYPHWVQPGYSGERYSLIYYSTWHAYQSPTKAYYE